MPVNDYNDYKNQVSSPTQRIQDTKTSTATNIGRCSSSWLTTPLGGVAPSAAETCDNNLAGCIGQRNGLSQQRIAQVLINFRSGFVTIVDRLIHSGGLDATLTSTQTVNTPALTRYTSGVQVFAALEVYTTIGTTTVVATVGYTNQSNAAKTVEVEIGATGRREVNRFVMCPLAGGDTGVKSVQSVTLDSSTTTAGNFGVTLFKPLYYMPITEVGSQLLFDSMLNCCGNCPVVENGACLSYIVVGGAITTGIIQSNIRFIEA